VKGKSGPKHRVLDPIANFQTNLGRCPGVNF